MNPFLSITFITLLPAVSGFLILGTRHHRLARRAALASALLTLAAVLAQWHFFDINATGRQFEEQAEWIPSLGITYHTGMDGLSLVMVLLSAIVIPMAIVASWHLTERVPTYFALLLFLQTGLIGTFTALNFFHWFLYWEISLIPAFFLIKLWGGPGRSPAATQFFVYTMVGSVALLLGFLALYLSTGKFDFADLAELGRNGTIPSSLSVQLGWYSLSVKTLTIIIFSGVFLGFAVKVPLLPFHTWLPDAYSEAPTGVTMVLTGVMSKMGVYGFLRILLPIFPEQMRWVLTPLLWLALLTIIVSAGSALAQKDLKRIFAYSSINHLGYCLLAIFAAARFTEGAGADLEKNTALNGAVLQMFNHGLTAASLFWFLGIMERRAGGLRTLPDFGGLRKNAPVFCGLMGIALFSSLGLPGLNGFVGEFLIFKGVFALAPWAACIAVVGLLLTALFLLNVLQKVFYGPAVAAWNDFSDLNVGERMAVAPAIGLMLVLGICPQLLLQVINGSMAQLVDQLKL
jgi:NADH-quinone oxidoreductase subunit M